MASWITGCARWPRRRMAACLPGSLKQFFTGAPGRVCHLGGAPGPNRSRLPRHSDDRVLDALLPGRHRTAKDQGRRQKRRLEAHRGPPRRAGSFCSRPADGAANPGLEPGPRSALLLEIRVAAVAAGRPASLRPPSLTLAAVTRRSAPGAAQTPLALAGACQAGLNGLWLPPLLLCRCWSTARPYKGPIRLALNGRWPDSGEPSPLSAI